MSTQAFVSRVNKGRVTRVINSLKKTQYTTEREKVSHKHTIMMAGYINKNDLFDFTLEGEDKKHILFTIFLVTAVLENKEFAGLNNVIFNSAVLVATKRALVQACYELARGKNKEKNIDALKCMIRAFNR